MLYFIGIKKQPKALLAICRLGNRRNSSRFQWSATGTGGDIMKRQPHDATAVTHPIANSHTLSAKRFINKTTRELFQKRDFRAVSEHLLRNVSLMTTSNLVTVLYLSGKVSHSLSSQELKMLTETLQEKNDVFNIMDVSNSCFGLQSYGENDHDVINLVTLLTTKIQESTEAFNSQAVGNAIYGLKNLSQKSKEVSTLRL
jgi:hypothetical protein